MTSSIYQQLVSSSVAAAVIAIASASAPAQSRLSAGESAAEINAANKLLRDGKVDEALEAFRHVVPGDQQRDELNYNMAVAEYRSGNIDAAEKLFSEVAGTGAPAISSSSRYNLGNCQYARAVQLAEQDKPAAIEHLRDAISHYRGALRGNPNNPDARANIELAGGLIRKLEQEQKQQEEEKKDGQEPQEKEDKTKEDQQQDQKDQPEQNKSEQQQQNDQENSDDQKDKSQDPESQPSDSQKDDSQKQSEQQKSDSKNSKSAQQKKDDQRKEEQKKQNEASAPEESENDEQKKDAQKNERPGEETQKSDDQKSPGEESQSGPQNPSSQQSQPKGSDGKQTQPQSMQQQSGGQQQPDEGNPEEQEAKNKPVPAGDLKAAGQQDENQKPAGSVGMADPTAKDGLMMTREEALKMLQSVRDRDMLRRMQQQRQERSRHVPVDRDW